MTDAHHIDDDSRPTLARGVRWRHDAARDRWVLMAPERVFVPDDVARDVLQRVDGAHTVAGIVDALSNDYDAPAARIREDVLHLLETLLHKGLITS